MTPARTACEREGGWADGRPVSGREAGIPTATKHALAPALPRTHRHERALGEAAQRPFAAGFAVRALFYPTPAGRRARRRRSAGAGGRGRHVRQLHLRVRHNGHRLHRRVRHNGHRFHRRSNWHVWRGRGGRRVLRRGHILRRRHRGRGRSDGRGRGRQHGRDRGARGRRGIRGAPRDGGARGRRGIRGAPPRRRAHLGAERLHHARRAPRGGRADAARAPRQWRPRDAPRSGAAPLGAAQQAPFELVANRTRAPGACAASSTPQRPAGRQGNRSAPPQPTSWQPGWRNRNRPGRGRAGGRARRGTAAAPKNNQPTKAPAGQASSRSLGEPVVVCRRPKRGPHRLGMKPCAGAAD